ncbi:glycosyltransferase family 2 protein [Sinirhodobacter sp. WL0062]|uniref:Glycosyltransferase family 2 protein n=1 Tax=Rhodobacter flavimaris TaxID=2907145 RepID=A0ABS8YU76_9RHOB|nr:glycosyltransferase family 2 protein [Sinirhodobacter sp. WL0062]MCE5972291.1 glycosyltransferase family 2 protein [Sinirhodobacter sp. WL0062]
MALFTIGMLWIGGPLSYLELLCMQSFLDAGHPVRFFTYGDVPNVPDGVEIDDAAAILPGQPFLRHTRSGSLSLHADLFRLRMLAQDDRIIWADTDAYCVAPWLPREGHYYAFQDEQNIASGVLALPHSSIALAELLASTEDPTAIPEWLPKRQRIALEAAQAAGKSVHVANMPWGAWGPTAVTHFLRKTGEVENALPSNVLYPISFRDRGKMLQPGTISLDDFGAQTTSVHFYGSRMRRMLQRRHAGLPPEGCLIDLLLKKHGIAPAQAPLPAEHKAEPTLPAARPRAKSGKQETFLAVTCMKDEGAFIPEWIAFHQAAGFDHFLIFTNDCSDGTDRMVQRLEELGIATHRDNTRGPNQRASYQIRAFRKVLNEPVYRSHDWAMILDADEYLNVHCGAKTVQDLVAAVPDADAFSLTWRVFGCGGIEHYSRGFMTEQFNRAAPLDCPRPAQAWGLKSLFRTSAFERLGTHRPLVPVGGDWDVIKWVNGSGHSMPKRYRELTRGNWRSSPDCVGYHLAQVNHYALRSRQSFLLKSLKGTVHGGIDRNLDYWQRMNRNEEEDRTISPLLPKMRDYHAKIMADPVIFKLYERACNWHEQRIRDALAIGPIAELYDELGA